MPKIFLVSFSPVMHYPTNKKKIEWAYKIIYQDFHFIVNSGRYLNLGTNIALREVYLHIKAMVY